MKHKKRKSVYVTVCRGFRTLRRVVILFALIRFRFFTAAKRHHHTPSTRKVLGGVFVVLMATCLFSILNPAATSAATGTEQEMSFEGKIVTSAGLNLPDGNYNMEFKIYTGCTNEPTSNTGCTAVWTEDYLTSNSTYATTTPVAFTSGTYAVNLGSICAFTTSSCEGNSNTAINWDTYPLYLSLNIGTTAICATSFSSCGAGDGAMNPYVLLTSTPYAMNAANANAVGGDSLAMLGVLAANNTWTGTNVIQDTSTTAFEVQSASGASTMLAVNTSANNVTLGSGTDLFLQGGSAYISNPQGQTEGEAFGNTALVEGQNSTSVGYGAYSGNSYDTTIGAGALTGGSFSVSIGSGTNVSGSYSFGMGGGASTIAGNDSIGIGYAVSVASGDNASIAIGQNATTTASDQLVIGGSTGNYAYINNAYFGSGVTDTAPTSVTLNATGGSGTNVGGASLSLAGGIGTGTGNGGNINLEIAKPNTTSGSTANTLTPVATISGITGAASFENAANSTSAFQVQNSTGNVLLDMSTTTSNLLVNSGFDNNVNNWTTKGTSTVSQDTSATNAYSGIGSLKAVATAASSGMQTLGGQAAFTTNILPSTQYQVTFFAKCSTAITTFAYGRQDVSGTNVNATTTGTCNTNWQQYTFHYTTGATITSPNIYMDSGITTSISIWVDDVSLVLTTTSAATNYQPGSIYLTGVIASPLTIENAANSTGALQVQNASGTNILDVDTTDGCINIGAINCATSGYGGYGDALSVLGTTTDGGGLYGENDTSGGYGVEGFSSGSSDSAGVFGQDNTSGGTGVAGSSTAGVGVSASSTSNYALTASSSSQSSIYLKSGSTSDSAPTLLIQQDSTGAASLLQAETAGGSNLLSVSPSNVTIGVGSSGEATPILLELDNGTSGTDPTEVNGAIYYNSSDGKFRCGQGGVWLNCVATAQSWAVSGVVTTAGSTVSTTYANYPGTNSSLSITKAASGTKLLIHIDMDPYSSTATPNTGVKIAVLLNGTDYQCGQGWINTQSVHTEMSCSVVVTGIAAGTYTAQIQWSDTNTSYTINADTNTWGDMSIQETD